VSSTEKKSGDELLYPDGTPVEPAAAPVAEPPAPGELELEQIAPARPRTPRRDTRPSEPTDLPPEGRWREELFSTIASIGIAVLPERLRRSWKHLDLARGTILSALIEMGLAAALLIAAFGVFQARVMHAVGDGFDSSPDGEKLGLGALAYVSFLITPAGIASVLVFGDGCVRLITVLLTWETRGSLFAWLADEGTLAIRRARARRQDGAEIPDEIAPDRSWIKSCRDRGWEARAVKIGDDFLVVERVDRDGSPPRRYTIHLRPLAAGEIVRRYTIVV
jgi:hypothetical protein